MLTIIKLVKNKIYLSNEEIIDVNPDIIHEYKLRQGDDITYKYTDVLLASIKNKAIFYIYLKPRTSYELISKLKAKYTNIDLINEAVMYMEECGYIDDVDYALSYILTHSNSRQKNYFKLMQKGIKKADIDLAYTDVPANTEEDQLEKEIAKLKENNIELPKIILKLTRKGYEYSKIKKVIDKMK